MRRLILWLCLGSALVSAALDNAAEIAVSENLMKSGISVGAQKVKGRYVFIGSAERKIEDPRTSKDLIRVRNELARVAEMRAKAKIAAANKIEVTAHESTEMVAISESVRVTTVSITELFAAEKLPGMSVLTSAESWDPASGLYRVAVAVAASDRLMKDAVGKCENPGLAEDEEWEKYLAGIDLGSVLGGRQFVDSKGRRRYIGIGCAWSGRPGAATLAKMQAKANLAFALTGDVVCRDILKQRMDEFAGKEVNDADAMEELTTLISQKASRVPLPASEVHFDASVVHPVSGRRMCVSVYGTIGGGK